MTETGATPAGRDESRGRTAGKFETVVRAKREPVAEARGTADPGTTPNQHVAVPVSRTPPPLGPATASRAVEQRAIDPAISQRPAPDAFRGTELYYVVGDEYFRGTSAPRKAYRSEHYWVVPQVRQESGEVVAYVAYNPDVQRNEFVIGPNELGFFFEHEALYKWLASSTYPVLGEPRPYQVSHGRMVASIFRGDIGGATRQYGTEWAQALNDPEWYVRMLGSVVGTRTASVTSESGTVAPARGVATSTEPPAAGTTTSTLPPTAGATSSSAAPSAEAAAAARARGATQGQTPVPPAVHP